MISIFLGAGFSILGGVPLASQLFDRQPAVDVVSRQRLLERVLAGWHHWKENGGGGPEQYLASIEGTGGSRWEDATWYVALVVALAMGNVERVGGKPTIVRHALNRTSGIAAHESFWTTIFRKTNDVAVITTNYDVIAERGLRPKPRPRVPRPGFNYGFGIEQLEGGGYPSYAHVQPIRVEGSVPLLKLHGSVSWCAKGGRVVRYYDCRPAIRGDALIVAPTTEKAVSDLFRPIWERAAIALRASHLWLFVGYSFPPYDMAINELVESNGQHRPSVHILNPDASVGDRVRALLPHSTIWQHPGLPAALIDLPGILND